MSSASPQRRAVIDVGTNSVKLLVADVDGTRITPIFEGSNQTRLGAGFYSTRQLKPEAITATVAAVSDYSARASELGAKSVRLVGTSAAREALNAIDLLDAIQRASGLRMEILSGDQEAEWCFSGVTSDPRLAHASVLVLDVGGGSSEFILGENSIAHFRQSYALGTVRLWEELRPGDPPGQAALGQCLDGLKRFLREQVAPSLHAALLDCGSPPELVATGGTPAIIARMEAKAADFDREKIESTVVSILRLKEMTENLWQLRLDERRRIPGLPSDRADVILTGVAIYEAIMEQFNFSNLRVSTRGLRYWGLLQR